MQEQDCYRKVAEEIDSGRQDRALWARALAESGGDADKTKALQIRRRVDALMATAKPAAARERFDRRLPEQLRNPSVSAAAAFPAQQAAAGMQMGDGLKVLAGVALVLGLGYLGLGYHKQTSEREIRMKEAELRREELHRKAEIVDRVVDNQETAIEAATGAQERQAAQAEQRRQQMEQSHQQGEARRRDSEAAAATRAIRQQAIQGAIAGQLQRSPAPAQPVVLRGRRRPAASPKRLHQTT